MKYFFVMMALLSANVFAGSGMQPQPQPQVPIQQSQTMTTQGSDQNQNQNSNSRAASVSNSSGGSNSLGAIDSGNQTSVHSYALALPFPAFVPPNPISGCPAANSEAHAWSIGFGLASKADSFVNTDSCVLITVYNSLLDRCQWASADKVLTGLTQKVLPGYTHEVNSLDLTQDECRIWKSPPISVPAPVLPVIPTVCPAPVPKKHVVKPKKSCG